MFMNNSNFGNVSSATLKILRVLVWVVNFFLFMRCSIVYEQKNRKGVMCDVENIGNFLQYLSDLSRQFGVVFFWFMHCSNVNHQMKIRKCVIL